MASTVLARGHALTGGLAMMLIAGFLSATLYAELLGGAATVVRTKQAILYLLLLLVPMLAGAGLSGRMLARGARGGPIGRKRRRMQMVGAIGALVLLPCAWLLAQWAAAGTFGPRFALVQAVEIVAGATNFFLLWRNFREGLRLGAPIRHRSPG